MRRSASLVAAVAVALSLTPAPAPAGTTKTVKMLDVEFRARRARVPIGGTVRWINEGSLRHTTTTKRAYPSSWDKALAPDRAWSKRFAFAGTFGYFCRPHSDGTSGMVGAIEVPVIATPSSGGNARTFTIRVGNATPPSGWAFDVQRKLNAGSWKPWKTGTKKRTLSYRSGTDGTHRFRSRLVRTNGAVRHGWSPAARITIR